MRYQKICNNDGAAKKKVEEWEAGGRKKRHAPSLEELEAKEVEVPYSVTKKEGSSEKDVVVKSRMRRSDHVQRVLELIGLKKKKENLCHHVPHKHCVMASSCTKVPF